MAKGKGKNRLSTGSATASGANDAEAANNAVDSLPSFSSAALDKLTKNIERKLQGDDKVKPEPRKKADETPVKEQRPPANNSEKKGKKRDRSGKVIASKPNGTPADRAKASRPKNALEQEIYAVGGTQDDYDLLAGVESGSEIEGEDAPTSLGLTKAGDDELRKDLATLLGGGSRSRPTASSKKAELPQRKKKEPAAQESKPAKPSATNQKGKKAVAENAKAKPQPQSTSTSNKRNLNIPPRPDWFSTPLPEIPSGGKREVTVARHVVERIREHAMSLLEAENKVFADSQKSSSSTYRFYSTILTSGTLNDKISALTLAVQESPLHNVKGLESLVGLAKKRSRAQAVEVLRSLKDLFGQGTLLPSDRKLRAMSHNPALLAAFEGTSASWTPAAGLPKGLEDRHLIFWAFEDFLKEQYFEVLKILEVWCNDEIDFARSRAVSYVYELLKEKPEQESNLLRLLINKLGDPSKKIASRASYLLLQLQQAHPLMKATIISAIEAELLFRPGQSKHAQYYGVITLNQTVLSSSEEKVAAQLLDIYFALFVSLLKSKDKPQDEKPKDPAKQKGGKRRNRHSSAPSNNQDEELREKLISGVLAGVNRAYPFTTSNTERLSKHIETLFRITHSSNFNTSIQALMLIQQLSSAHQVSAERFYRTLYESLLDPRIATSSKQAMYLNLLYKALKADLNMKRVKAFIKRLVQILSLHQPSFICGVLYLIRELETASPSLTSLVDQPEEHEGDDDVEVFRDVPDEDEQAPAEPIAQGAAPSRANVYDSRKRDPERSNADKSCLWELLPYLSHFHPSVSVAALQLLNHEKMSGKPDLTIHTLSHFLDRFVYRTPKTTPGLRGTSIMQPLAGGDTSGLLVTSARSGKPQEAVNSESFWQKKTEDIAAEDVFFHDYFNRLGKDKLRAKLKADKKKRKKTDDEIEGGSQDESEAESEVWKALVESRPEVGGGLESDEDDFDMEDFENAMEDGDDLDGSGSESEVIFNEEDEDDGADEDVPAAAKADKRDRESEEDEGGAFDMDVSSDDAFRDSDEEIPSDLEIEGFADEEPAGKLESKRDKRRKLKHLPTFASVEDYAALLEDEDSG